MADDRDTELREIFDDLDRQTARVAALRAHLATAWPLVAELEDRMHDAPTMSVEIAEMLQNMRGAYEIAENATEMAEGFSKQTRWLARLAFGEPRPPVAPARPRFEVIDGGRGGAASTRDEDGAQ